MNLELTWQQAEEATGGTLLQGDPEGLISVINTDTRDLKAGQVFLALKGERFDAHEYQLQAAEKGAAGLILQRRSNRLPPVVTVLKVGDTLKALQALSGLHRARFTLKVAAVAGSNGKTTVKEMLRAMCAAAGPTVATAGNRNNQVGLPLTLFEIGPAHRFAVFELGDSHVGDIAPLARLANPDAGVITNVGPEHLEFFGGVENVFKTKMELIDAMSSSGRVALNADDPWLAPVARRLGERAVAFGRAAGAQVRLLPDPAPALEAGGRRIALDPDRIVYPMNAAAAAAGAIALGIAPDRIEEGLAAFQPPPLRMETRRHPGGAVLVVDAYNANPVSTAAALEWVCRRWPDAEKIAVLGDMKELGAQSEPLHRELGLSMRGLPLAAAYLGGPHMAAAAQALAGAVFPVRHAEDPQEWIGELKEEVRDGRVLLLKASRVMGFERIADQL